METVEIPKNPEARSVADRFLRRTGEEGFRQKIEENFGSKGVAILKLAAEYVRYGSDQTDLEEMSKGKDSRFLYQFDSLDGRIIVAPYDWGKPTSRVAVYYNENRDESEMYFDGVITFSSESGSMVIRHDPPEKGRSVMEKREFAGPREDYATIRIDETGDPEIKIVYLEDTTAAPVTSGIS